MYVIAAVGHDGSLGLTDPDGTPRLPWPRLEADQRWFQTLTTAMHPDRMLRHLCRYPATVGVSSSVWSEALWQTRGNVVICGWRTAQTLPQPLPNRITIVLRDRTVHGAGDWPCKARTFQEALDKARETHQAPNIWAIGGSQVYAAALRHDTCTDVMLTEVEGTFPTATTWWPARLEWGTGRFSCGGVWWYRTLCSPWITTPDRPRYRLSGWIRMPTVQRKGRV